MNEETYMPEIVWTGKIECQTSSRQRILNAKILPVKDPMCHFSGQRNLFGRIFTENETYILDEMWIKELIQELFYCCHLCMISQNHPRLQKLSM